MTGGTVIGRERRRLALGAAVAALAVVAALATGGPARAGAGGGSALVDIGDFDSPVFVDDAPGAPGHLYVVEQGGTIEVLVSEAQEAEPFLDIADIVASGGEEGLLSVAFDPDYESNRLFYVYYTTNSHDIRIDRFRRRADDPLSAGVGSRKKVIKIEHDQANNHNGGQLQFGPDGYLYAGIGDGGPQGDPENDAQKKKSLLGKLLRIDPLPQGGYDNPPDNPYVGVPGSDEIAARGLRNPWRFSFDSATGALLLADVGGGAQEEVDYDADQGIGENFGWNDYEGFAETAFGTGATPAPTTSRSRTSATGPRTTSTRSPAATSSTIPACPRSRASTSSATPITAPSRPCRSPPAPPAAAWASRSAPSPRSARARATRSTSSTWAATFTGSNR